MECSTRGSLSHKYNTGAERLGLETTVPNASGIIFTATFMYASYLVKLCIKK